MKRKTAAKLFLHRETLGLLQGSELRAVAGATAQLGCGNTLNDSCKGTCVTCGICPPDSVLCFTNTCPNTDTR